MLKVAIVDFGHVDSIISLAKYLGKKIKVDLFLTFSQQYKFTSIINFQNIETPNGLLSNDLVRKVLGNEIIDYLNGFVNVNVFMYSSPKLKDIKNYYLFKRFANFLNKNNYDIIHFNGNSLFESLLHKLLKNRPRVHTIHDVNPHTGEGSWKTKFRLKYLSLQNINFILQSDFSLHEFNNNKLFKDKRANSIFFGPLEIYKSYSKNKKDNSFSVNKIILFFGRISPYKGIEYLVDAVKLAKNSVPNIKLIIAGKGDFYFNIDEIKNDNSFEIINKYISNSELVELILKSNIVVCPYTDATQSGVVMTSFAFNKPVIASAVGGFNDVIENGITGFLVQPKSPEALADAIIKFFCNDDITDNFNKNIIEFSENGKLSWKKIADQTIDVYQKAISEQKIKE